MLAIAAVLAGRMLLARLIGLTIALLVARRVVARYERLRLRRDETGLLPEIRKALALASPSSEGISFSVRGCGWF